MTPTNGADAVPFVGPALDPRQFLHDPLGTMWRLHREHGDLVLLVKEPRHLLLAFGPAYNQQILSDPGLFQATGFLLPGPKKSAQRRLACGLFNMNGTRHREHRRLSLPPFHKGVLASYRDAAAGLIEEMLAGWQPGSRRDLALDMRELTLRQINKLLLDLPEMTVAHALDRIFEQWIDLNNVLILGASLPGVEAPASYHEMLALAEQLEPQFKAMLEQKRLLDPGNDILAMLLQAHADGPARMTDEELLGQLAILFGAAHHTSMNAATWTLFLLAQHPAVMADLLDELTAELHGAVPTAEQLGRLPLLDHVVKESLRVLPPVAYYTRRNSAPVQLGPCFLPPGSTVVFSHFVTHHMPELFPWPERFWPQRWAGFNPSPYAYLPFGAGPRMCIGAGMATLTLKLTVATVVQRFRLAVVPGTRIDRKVSTTLGPGQGMPMIVRRQDRQFTASPVCGDITELLHLPTAQAPAAAA